MSRGWTATTFSRFLWPRKTTKSDEAKEPSFTLHANGEPIAAVT